MKVWIVDPYGNIPGDGWQKYRFVMVAEALEAAGHETIWWTANFEHRSKKFRSDSWKDIPITHKFLVRLIPTAPYTSHISLKRIWFEKIFIKRFYIRARIFEPPDILIIREPALFISAFVLKYVRKKRVKLIVDIHDLHPEIFHILLPGHLASLGKLFFMPLYRRRALLFKKADGIIAVSNDYLEIARKIAGTEKVIETVYCGVDVKRLQADMMEGTLPLTMRNLTKKTDEIWMIYAGTMGNNYDIKTILKVAERLEKQSFSLKLILAGDGPLKGLIIETITEKRLRNTIYIGNIDAHELPTIYGQCDIGLSSYIAGSTVSMPLKVFDYLAAGLPIINSLERDLGEIIIKYRIGLQYEAEDPEALFAAIKKLCKNSDLRRTMSNNAFRMAKMYDSHRQYAKYIDVIKRVKSSDNC